VKHARLNFMVPIPEAASFDELNEVVSPIRTVWRLS
jgi:hypothetical protein